MTDKNSDLELVAIRGVLDLLTPLDDQGRDRVLQYVFERLGIRASSRRATITEAVLQPAQVRPDHMVPAETPPASTNIRSLREEKTPRNAVEMATLVAYYLAHAAPDPEHRETIGSAELKKYFIQAGYPVPSQPRFVLFNAKAAGYLEPKEHGSYKLTPVGYNLVVHRMPSSAGSRSPVRRSAGKRHPGRTKTTRNGRRSK